MQIKIIKFEEKEKESGFLELSENEYRETESENKQKKCYFAKRPMIFQI